MRTRLLIGAVALMLVGCSPEADERGTPSTSESTTEAIAISLADFMLDPDDVTATGPTLTFEVTNDGPTPHNFTVRNDADEVVAATDDLSAGESETLDAELEPGTYTIFCSLAGHESLGMSGTLTVTGP
jgi:plastocyanin